MCQAETPEFRLLTTMLHLPAGLRWTSLFAQSLSSNNNPLLTVHSMLGAAPNSSPASWLTCPEFFLCAPFLSTSHGLFNSLNHYRVALQDWCIFLISGGRNWDLERLNDWFKDTYLGSVGFQARWPYRLPWTPCLPLESSVLLASISSSVSRHTDKLYFPVPLNLGAANEIWLKWWMSLVDIA